MAAQLLALYGEPTDPTAFEQYYRGTHIPLAKRLPGLKSYTISKTVSGGDGKPAYYLVAILEFDSMDAIGAAVGSPEGQAAVADVPKFATGGCTIVTYETESV